MPLKDMLWSEITSEANQILAQTITHRRLDGHHRVTDEDELVFDEMPIEEEEEAPDYGMPFLDEDADESLYE